MTRHVPLLLSTMLLAAASASAATTFELDDQYGKPHTNADIFSGQPVIMFVGMERKTPDAMEAWDKALRAKAPAARVVGLSNLEGVPFFIPKSSINKTLVKQVPKTTVLCDWDGDVYQKLGFPKGVTIAVAVFDGFGRLLGVVEGPATDARVAKVLEMIPESSP
ncbi:MAG: hypothetical protein AAF997_13385 [Myxococcota bacterium]